ncbi:MAG: hypothetical protein Q8M37_08585 [Nevskia sp.]|nr:hypothetical protein [Nevskia sp.]
MQHLTRGDEPMESRIDAVLDAVARLPDPTLIFIDNLGYCADETLGTLLDLLVFRTPSSASPHCSFAIAAIFASTSTGSSNCTAVVMKSAGKPISGTSGRWSSIAATTPHGCRTSA